ncbi:restriction endonuclease subunit R [Nostocaceae cyanobacterium CENA357]|uniref:Restriction endonuclease subunit R n=1 Tax=Atlanticothrix silvestris CENA357 TaxID=1725252 RepID=A0A8J7L4B3_9CYAN|nr:restriction endonuclease subunit R [Atlanticothrix silvestris]MBH8555800.1 restriction endonuclease subunit R [Atlanticothrix silvestris CENA357]
MTILNTRNLSLEDVQRLFGFQKQYNNSFSNLLSLEPLSEDEQQELLQIQNDFDRYLTAGKVSEGQIKFLVLAPLLRLAGFYRYPLEIRLEENIADIEVEDEDLIIKGRMDILAVTKAKHTTANAYFWILLIESKNSSIALSEGLPQLLTYAYKSLRQQNSVWGLVTNGQYYQFVYIQQKELLIYQLMPLLHFMESPRAIESLQVLKAICQL